MRILTDTHTLVWALSGPAALGSGARVALANAYFTASVANFWEIVLKLRKLGALVADLVPWWHRFVVGARIPALAILSAHIRALPALPDHPNNLFEGLLVAQALAEGLVIETKDAALGRYGASVVWE